MSDPNAVKLDTSQAAKALDHLKESASAVTRAFVELKAADPKQFMAQMAQLATSVASMNQDIIKSFSTLEKAVEAAGASSAAKAKKAGKDMSKALAAGMDEGEESVRLTMREQTRRLQDWYEDSLAQGWNFKAAALAKLKAQGVNLGPDFKADAFAESLRAKSATKMSEDDTRAMLGMPSRDEMKVFAAGLKTQLREELQLDGLRAKSATKLNEDDTRALLGMPDRSEMKSFAASLKSQLRDEMQTAGLRAKSATKLSEDDTRYLLGMPDRSEMKSFAASLKAQLQEELKTGALRAKSATRMSEDDTRALLGMPDRSEMKGFAASLKAQMREDMQTDTLRAKSASKMTEEDTRALLGMPGRVEMAAFSASLKAQMQEAARDSKVTGTALKELTSHSNDLHSAARGLASGFNAMWLTWGNLVPLLAGAAVSNAFVQAVKSGSEFENTLRTIAELSGESADGMSRISAAALELGANSKYGPNEVALGLKTLALAGLDAEKQLAAIKPVMNFATVGEMGLDKAAESITAIATAFGYTADGFDAVGDVIAKSAAISMSSVGDMTEAFRQASTVAQQFGVNVTDASTTLALLSQVGIKGSAAGTAMRNMYNELLGSSKQARDVLTKYLGVDIIDNATKSVKSLSTIFADLGGALQGYDFESQLRLLQAMGNERGGKAISAVLTAAVTELRGSGQDITTVLADMQQKLADAPGFVARAAAGMALSAQNQMKLVSSAMQASLIEAFQDAEPTILEVSTALRQAFASEEFKQGLKTLVEGVSSFISLLVRNIDVIAAVASGFAIATTTLLALNAATAAATVVLPALGAAIGTVTAAGGVSLAALAAAFWPVAAAIAAVTLAWAVFGRQTESDSEKAVKAARERGVAVTEAMRQENERLEKQMELRRKGVKEEEIQAAERSDRARQELINANLLIAANGRVARSRILAEMAEVGTGSPIRDQRQKALEGQLAALRGQIADDVLRGDAQVDAFDLQLSRLTLNSSSNALKAAQKAKDTRIVPAGEKVFTPLESSGARNSLPRDNELQALQATLRSEESALKARYDDNRKLLELDHKYKLVSEGEYQAKVLQDSLEFEDTLGKARVAKRVDYEIAYVEAVERAKAAVKSGKLKPESLEGELENLANNRKAFMAEQQAKDTETLSQAETRRAAALKTIRGEVNLAQEATEKYIATMQRDLDAEAALLRVKREHAEDTPATRARFEAEQAFVAKHATEIANLTKKYTDLQAAADSMRSKFGPFPANGEAADAVLGTGAAADAAGTNLAAAKAAVSRGATQAGSQAADAIRDQQDALRGARAAFVEYRDTANNVFKSVGSLATQTLKGMEDAFVTFAKTGKLEMGDLVNTVLDGLLRIAVQKSITAPLGDMMTSGMGSLGNFLFNAKGNAFDTAGVVPFAKGGVFDSPTMFGFGGGRLGVLGEAGPEAVVPLQRGSDGTLGLATGGNNVNLTVNIIEDSSKAGTTQMRRDSNGGNALDVFVEKVKSSIASDIARGDGAVPNAISSTYGLNRAAGVY